MTVRIKKGYRTAAWVIWGGLFAAGCTTQGVPVVHDDAGDDAGEAIAEPDAEPLLPPLALDASVAPDAAPDLDPTPPPPVPDAAPEPPAPMPLPPPAVQVPLPSHPSCAFGRGVLQNVTPGLMLVLDRSGSMRLAVPGTMHTRWEETLLALEDVLPGTGTAVPWGLKLFPSREGCEVSDGVEIPPAPNSASAVLARVKATMPNGGAPGSPLHEGVRTAANFLRQQRAKAPQFLVMASDGEPTCPAGADGTAAALTAVKGAVAAGARTFVLGVAMPGSAQHKVLNDLAVAGGEPVPGDTKYYTMGTRQQLRTALQQIAAQVTRCVFSLENAPPSPENVALYLDGQRAPFDPKQLNGWSYGATPTTVQVYGAACEGLKSGKTTRVELIFGCPGVPVP